jgi:two-component system OmpR family response regulator
MSHVLVVDDEPRIREVVQYALEREGYRVTTAADAKGADLALRSGSVDLVVLDIMLPDKSGLELCRSLRERRRTPVLFLSARGEELDRIIGLEVGGDDYLSKPFSPRELVARVRAVLRRAQPVEPDASPEPSKERTERSREPLRVGDLQIDAERHEVRAAGEEVRLTHTEFSILEALAARPGVVFTREQLILAATDEGVHIAERTIDTHVRRIRSKLRERGIAPIETVHGVGYKLRESP